jgi:hypothetical protein
VFVGECIPDLEKLLSDKGLFSEFDRDYPHAWKGGIACFVLGLAIMVRVSSFFSFSGQRRKFSRF